MEPSTLDVIKDKMEQIGLTAYLYTSYLTVGVGVGSGQRTINVRLASNDGSETTLVNIESSETYETLEDIDLADPDGWDKLMGRMAKWLAEIKSASLSEITTIHEQYEGASRALDTILIGAMKNELD